MARKASISSEEALQQASALVRRCNHTKESSLVEALDSSLHRATCTDVGAALPRLHRPPESPLSTDGGAPARGNDFRSLEPMEGRSTATAVGSHVVDVRSSRSSEGDCEVIDVEAHEQEEQERVEILRQLWPRAALSSLENTDNKPIGSRALCYPVRVPAALQTD
jgi:hypothetical protein